ncbi:hypothetical protein H8356DRAFT_1351879 [Neocallimastix lanati (nom. inval.)]|nr:hypothetical protein H8356DRAFT_1351879 [Neocallimastix sp. JGI-2020a]
MLKGLFPNKYIPLTTVVFSEIIKLVVSSICHLSSQKINYNFKMFLNEIFSKQYEWYKVLIQVSLYLLQNNIIYTIASKLDPDCLFKVLILKRMLTLHQWKSIFILTIDITNYSRYNNRNFTWIYFEKVLKNKLSFFSIVS